MKGATGCGIKLREKLCSYVWLASQITSWATVIPRRSAATTRRKPAWSEPPRPYLAVEFVREQMRRRHTGKVGV